MPLFDTHAHYDSGGFNADRHDVLSALPAGGVALVVNPGCDLPSSRAAVELAERYSYVYAAVGIHPSDCAGTGEAEYEALRELAERIRVSEEKGEAVRISDLAIGGDELIALGFRPGRLLQDILCELLEAVWQDPSKNTREELIRESLKRKE